MTNLERYQSMSAEEFVNAFGYNSLCDLVQDEHRKFCDKHEHCGGCLIEFLNEEEAKEE
ncbi:MAG: hypothetical protein II264_04575 [Ruminococcus sp.]|nr:hypothetical protein [Ruminococcus sp.]